MNEGVPLYYRIANHLRNRIMAGIYRAGEKIPTEQELCDEFNISRITVRQALKILEEQGMIQRRQGIGTLVSQSIQLQPISFNGYVEDIIFQLLPARVIFVQKREIAVSDEVRKRMNLSPDTEKVVELERVRAIGDELNSYAINYLPLDIGRQIEEDSLIKHSLIEVIDQIDPIHRVTQTIQAKPASERVATNLGMNIGDPVLFSEYFMVNRNERPVNLGMVFYHGERYKYTVKMNRLTEEKQ